MALAAGALAATSSTSAHASPSQLALFQDDPQLLNRGDAVRDARLDEIAALGADAVKVQLTWSSVAPGARRKPPGFDPGDPAAYPEEGWERFDALIRAATLRGLRVLVALSPPAPGWATRPAGDPRGVERPDAPEFGHFVRAVATRYDGAHADALGQPLPRVSFWSIWNEPNHPQFLLPLGSRRGVPVAPHLYRQLVREAVTGLRATGHGADEILFGELLPIGRDEVGPRYTIKPLLFLREFFCLDRGFRPFRGRAARARGCHRFRPVRGVSGFAHHPYTRPEGPRAEEPTADDATIRSWSRISRTLDRAAARGRLERRGLPLYNTEFGYQSRPPDPHQVPLGRIPRFLNEAEWMSYRNRRVASWSQYGLLDDPLRPRARGAERFRLYQAGLRFASGVAKPGVYDAYRLPIFARLLGPSAVEIWGAARSAEPGERVTIEQRRGRRGAFRALPGGGVTIQARGGYFRRRYRISRASGRSFRLRHSVQGVTRFSRTATAVVR